MLQFISSAYPWPTAEEEERVVLPLFQVFVREMLEALVLIILVSVVSDKPMQFDRIFRAMLVVACITTFLERYNPDVYKTMKQGMTSSAGGNMIRPMT